MSTARLWPMRCKEENPINSEMLSMPAELGSLARSLGTATLCLDTEFVRRTTYYPILALLQLARGEEIWLIDTPAVTQWQDLLDAFDQATMVMHSASEDLEVFRTNLNWHPARLFDTQIAAAFVGLGSALSYAALVEQLLGVVLGKSETQSDWLARPLSPAQMDYARDDVRYLDALYRELSDRLASQGKTAWMQAYMEQQLRSAAEVLNPDLAYLKIKGAVGLSQRQLSLVAELAAWRERRARELDKPRNWLVRDGEILKIARHRPTGRSELDRVVGMAPESIRRYSGEILALVAAHQPAGTIPQPPAALAGQDKDMVKQLQDRVEQLATQHRMASRLIANRSELEQLVRHRRQQGEAPALLTDWRAPTFGKPLSEMIDAAS